MEQRLYLFEVVIDNIYFDEGVSEIPQKKQIIVSVKLGRIASLEIRSETLPVRGEGGNKRLIDFNAGKSYLAALVQENLLQELNNNLEISVGTRGSLTPIGTSSAPWDDSFKEMVQVSDEEFVTPASISDNFCLMQEGAIKGNVQLFLRLSCFGKSIQTHFEVLIESGQRQFLFKMPNVATTFMCSKYGVGTSNDFIPVGPLYTTGLMKTERNVSIKSASWTAVMEGRSTSMVEKRSSQQSICLFPEYLNIVPPVKDSAITFDIVSLRARPEEEKFIDFLTGKKMEDLEGSIASFVMTDIKNTTNFFNCESLNKSGNEKVCGEEKILLHIRTPLRLRGGGTTEDGYVISERLRGGAPFRSPLVECREIMDQFDKILEEYRKALPPCGQISCNYTPNVTEGLCKKTCEVKPENTNTTGCGLPECQYAKYKKALMVMDADIEKQFIGPAILGTCGHPKCSYRAEPNLPPIHWDCPEPLPVGKCKNPNCPYPQEIKPQEKFAATKGPCGSDLCPYAPPAPCSSPNCPFKSPPPCAKLKEKPPNSKSSKPSSNIRSSSSNLKNKSSIRTENKPCPCPFDNPLQTVNFMFCDNPTCENAKRVTVEDCAKKEKICISPNCPYKDLQNKPSPHSKGEMIGECSNQNCPLGLTEGKSSCSNPKCPFTNSAGSSLESSTGSACSNPDCPYRSSSQESKEPPQESCANPECPFNKPSFESCQNPECPFLNKDSSIESKESCDNPECPYKKSFVISNESESVCECDNPTCPSKKDTCANPNCPFNLRGLDVCTNPHCPHKTDALGRDLGFCATPEKSFNEFCGDKTCPYHDKKLEKEGVKEVDHLGRSFMMVGSKEVIEQGSIEKTIGVRPSVYDMAPCGLRTCKYMGGHLTCVECGVGTDGKKRAPCPKTCPGDPLCAMATARKSKKIPRRKDPVSKRVCMFKKKKRKQLSGLEYPGYKIGHRECVMPYFYVPPKMGWLWNIHTPCMNLKPRRGWRPGAITRTVAKAILKHKKSENSENHEEKKVRKRRHDEDSEDDLICPKPTLEIKKREGIYHITMNPLKDPEKLQMNENPYVDCNPMKFKVAKNNLLDPDCICTDEGEFYKYDSSSDDELDIQITTPAGIIHPDRPVQKKVVSVKQTQYNQKDVELALAKGEDKKRESNKAAKEKAANDKEKDAKGKEKDSKGKDKGDKGKDKGEKDRGGKEKPAKDKGEKEKPKKGKK